MTNHFAASELLKLGSNQATAHRLLGDSYIMIDKYADAEAEFLKAQQIDKSDYTIMARLVDARYLQGNLTRPSLWARNLHEAHPDYGPVPKLVMPVSRDGCREQNELKG